MKEHPQRIFNDKEQALLEEIMIHRRDVRGNHFLDTPISQESINKIIEAALAAPSVGFSQPWEFVLIRDQKTKQAVKETFSEETARAAMQFTDEKQKEYIKLKLEGILESPLNMAVFYKPAEGPVLGQTSMPNMGKYSVVCAIQNMWLMARSLNIGMGWVSILDPEKVKQVLEAPEQNQLIGYLCFGYTDMFYNQPELELKKWDRKKFQKEVVIEEKYK
ncbi:5,6-dimethylbenzimidazole synthase [Aquimarina sp. EL_43]|uniref:5,6-dimethylbenzimidazole synthase n=1 Tax=Aquimarina TaxID=290174 RepID=UPI0004729DB6|nr:MULTISPECIES: 5,6-dimethylbenzimidazole synthase [Aquimarina]MBG6130284.1 5,6-dimethylbenzimidazole synthase [Aquimarina sp. EL_35]MBG6149064.1 5,6-dimethylbenzimidazole synthase [Aquimarina sp. EL_32]MBG6168562.1 5,6-dimethylbenzimidazole synthase [Aquimarina sp. EL_43]